MRLNVALPGHQFPTEVGAPHPTQAAKAMARRHGLPEPVMPICYWGGGWVAKIPGVGQMRIDLIYEGEAR